MPIKAAGVEQGSKRQRHWKAFAVATMLMVLLPGFVAAGQSKTSATEQVITSFENQMKEAALKGDLAASEKYLGKDFVRVYPDGSLVPTDDLRNGIKFTAIDISELQVHVTGDTAVSTFTATVKATIHEQDIDGVYRGVRTWANDNGQWKAVAYTSTRIGHGPSASSPPPSASPEQHAHVNDNVFVSDNLPKLALKLDPKFQYVGSFPFDISGLAGGYRYVWGETDGSKHLRRVFIVQAEGYYPGNNGTYKYGTPHPATLGGEAYEHGLYIYDNDQSAREDPGKEADLTRKFMLEKGYDWEPQLVMSRFARVVDESKKNEIIFFYLENLKDYTAKKAIDFPEEAQSKEQKTILETVDAHSLKAFSVQN
jgi:hypothetical protein